MEEMEATKANKKDETTAKVDLEAHTVLHKGFFLVLSKVDLRDIKGEDALMDPNDSKIVLRPKVEPFPFKSWIYGGNWVLKVPLLDWTDRGNDDHILRKKYGKNAWFKSYMDGLDDFRKALIIEHGGDLQTMAKHVVFKFKSSEDPQRVFQLDGSVVKVNDDRESDLKPRLLTHDVLIGTREEEVMAEKIHYEMKQPFVRLAFAVADTMLGVKRRGQDRFESAAANELASMLDADLNFTG